MDFDNFENNFPSVVPLVYRTESGVEYLKSPGVAVVAIPNTNLSELEGFLESFPYELEFFNYLHDPIKLSSAETLCKAAGQLCYLSFGPNRTMNEKAADYFKNIKESGHGSVFEHANFSVVWWGISRSVTHELVRHRAGFAFSQVSQRYVGGKTLRFVERPEYQADPSLHEFFVSRIDRAFCEYEKLIEYLIEKQKSGEEILSAERKTDLRKKVRQAARSLLPNETEAPIMVTANVRAWRHFFNMRVSEHAEVEIRRVGFETFRCIRDLAPLLFSDFSVVNLSDGTHGLSTPYPKV